MNTLLDSAAFFFQESLRNYRSGSPILAVLHVTTAVELLLKARLARIHPNLIFEKLDAKVLNRSRTVGLLELPFRLSHRGVAISPEDLETIREVARWRNEIVHHTSTFPHESAVAKLGKIYNFTGQFLVDQLGVDLKSVIPPDLFKIAGELLENWKWAVAEARKKAANSTGTLLSEACPFCGAKGVLVLDSAGAVLCHFCEKLWKYAGTCPLCGKPAVGDSPGEHEGEVYHDTCLSDYGEHWMQMRAEIGRGE